MSQVHEDPDLAMELFMLEPLPGVVSDEDDQAVAGPDLPADEPR